MRPIAVTLNRGAIAAVITLCLAACAGGGGHAQALAIAETFNTSDPGTYGIVTVDSAYVDGSQVIFPLRFDPAAGFVMADSVATGISMRAAIAAVRGEAAADSAMLREASQAGVTLIYRVTDSRGDTKDFTISPADLI